MRRKLNWKVIAGLVALVALGGGVLGLVKARVSAPALLKRGDTLAEQGDFSAAFDAYRRGLHREPNNLLLLSKCATTIQGFEPEPLGTALEHTRFMMKCYEQILSIDPVNEAAQNALLRLEHDWALALNDSKLWQALYDRATDLIASARIMQAPANPEARRALAIADMKRGVSVDLEEAEERIRDYLTRALDEFPDDEELMVLLANYYVLMGQRIRQQNGLVEAARLFDEAEAVLAERANTPLVRIARARILFSSGRPAEALVRVRALESEMSGWTDRTVLQAAVNLYRAFEPEMLAAEPALQYGVDSLLGLLQASDPEVHVAQMLLVDRYKMQKREAELESTLLLLWEGQQVVRPGVSALIAASLRPVAGSELVNLYLYRYEQSQDPDYLGKSRIILDLLLGTERDDALLPMLEGRLAFAEGNLDEAIEKFIEVETRFGIADAQTLHLMARTFWRLGELDSAQDRLLQIVRRGSVVPGVCLDLSRLYVQQQNLVQAQRYADLGVRLFPDHKGLQSQQLLLQARSLRSRGQPEQALAALEQVSDHPAAALLLAQVEVQLGHREQAAERLRALAAPTPSALFLLADLTQDPSVLNELEAEVWVSADRFDATYQLYEYHQQAGRTEKALRFLNRALQLRPHNYRILAELLRIRIEAADWGEAERLVQRARELNVDQVNGYAFEGELQFARGQWEEAEVAFQQAVNLRPQDSEFWRRLGEVSVQSGKLASAREAYERAVKLRPDRLEVQWALHRLYHLQGDVKRAADTLEQLAKVSGAAGVRNTYLNYVARYLDPEQALEERRSLALAEPENLLNLRAIAALHGERNDWVAARAVWEKLNANPERQLIDVEGLAQVLFRQGDSSGGLTVLRAYVTELGERAGVAEWLALARMESLLKNLAPAERYYRKALAQDQTGRVARLYAAWLKSNGLVNKALEQFRQVKEETGQASDWLRYITTLLESGSRERASSELVAFLQVHPEDAQTQILSGLIAEQENRTEDAAFALDQAVQLDPLNSNALFQRAWFTLRHLEIRALEDAIRDLMRALELNPDLTDAREMLAQAEAVRSGGEMRAVMQYLQVIERSPDRKNPYLALANLYLRQKEYWQLDQLLERARSQFPGDPAWSQLKAQMLTLQGREQEALVVLERQFSAAPDAATLESLAPLALRLERYTEVLELLDPAATWMQESGFLMGTRGIALWQTGQQAEGVRSVVAGLTQVVSSHRNLPRFMRLIREFLPVDDQITVCKSFLEQEYNEAVCGRLAELYIAERMFAEADALLEDGLARSGDQVLLWQQRSSLRMAQGIPEEALKACEQVLAVDEHNLLALNNAAHLLSEELGQPERALFYAEQAVELGGRQLQVSAGLLDTLGMVHYRLSNFEQALFYFNRSLKLSVSDEAQAHAEMVRKKLVKGE